MGISLVGRYMEMGAKCEAVGAMDKSAFHLTQITQKPGMVDMSDRGFRKAFEEMQLNELEGAAGESAAKARGGGFSWWSEADRLWWGRGCILTRSRYKE